MIDFRRPVERRLTLESGVKEKKKRKRCSALTYGAVLEFFVPGHLDGFQFAFV